MSAPENISSLQSFVGLANYYNVFVQNMHCLRASLYKLLKKTLNVFKQQSVWKQLKQIQGMLTSDLFLTHYDPKKEIIVASDTSSYRIEACIMHRLKDSSIKPIACAYRTLIPAEKKLLSNRKSLGIVFALKKFHRFLHGRRFTLQTDHRPLLSIFGSKKGLLTHIANRLQRCGTISLNYDFMMEFLLPSKLCHADGLSRLIPPPIVNLWKTRSLLLKERK